MYKLEQILAGELISQLDKDLIAAGESIRINAKRAKQII